MVDLDSSPTKLLDIVEIGKQILITRGSLTTFSVANDVAKYFAIIPALFAIKYPILNILNIMHLANPQSAILSAVIFNAIVIPCLIPLSLRGVQYKQTTAEALLIRNIFIYGLGGLILPFIGIKIIDIWLYFCIWHKRNIIMIKETITALKSYIIFSILLGIIYPLVITLIAQGTMPDQS